MRRELSTELFHPLNENKVKTREVDYKQMKSEAIEDMQNDFRNELAAIENRKEWLLDQIEEMEDILNERSQEECETSEDE